MIRRFIGKVSLNKHIIFPAGTLGTTCVVTPVYSRYSVTKDDFPKRNLFDKVFNIKKTPDKWFLEHKNEYIDCTGLNPYDVLAHLYNSCSPLGMGWLQNSAENAMTRCKAEKILDKTLHLDYLEGRPMKLNFEYWPYLCPSGYDSRNGNGAGTMKKLIAELRESGQVSKKIPEKKTDQEIADIVTECQQSLQIIAFTENKKGTTDNTIETAHTNQTVENIEK